MKILIVACCFLMLITLTACGGREYKDLQQYVEKLKKDGSQKPKKVALHEFVHIPQVVTYKSAKFRAPFANPELQAGPKTISTDPLRNYPLTMLRFVGTLIRNNRVFAYVQAPNNMIYEVKEGDIIGNRYGKVTSIEPHRLHVRENELKQGKPMQRFITIQLKEDH